MFRDMRRANQALSRDLCLEILESSENGVLALAGDEGYPYAVPLNHVLLEGKLYFHCALEGHKIDAIRSCGKASYCVVDADRVDAGELSTHFRSVIAFGRARMVEDIGECKRALLAISRRFAPDNMLAAQELIEQMANCTGIIEFTIEHLSGKESKTLAKERRERA